MRTHRCLTAGVLAGLAAGIISLLALLPQPVQGGDDPAAGKKDSGKAVGRPAKTGAAEDPKPAPRPEDDLLPAAERGYKGSAAYRWLNVALQATAREHERNGPRPTIGSRNLGIVVTAMFDAWAAYDATAVGTRLGDKLRRPRAERTDANKEKAIATAVTRVLLDMYRRGRRLDQGAGQARRRHRSQRGQHRRHHARRASAMWPATALLAYRHHDGANQLGDEPGSNGKPYSDWTYYKCANPPGPAPLVDPNCWQPIPFDNGKGGTVTIGLPDAAVVPGQAVRPGAQRPVPPGSAPEGRLGTAQEGSGRVHRRQHQPHGGAEGRRRVHARRAEIDRAIGSLADVRQGRVPPRQERHRPRREAVLRRRQRLLRCLHFVLGDEAALR